MKNKGLLIIISGPSGVGKDTIVREYLKKYSGVLSISYTTRPPKNGEINKKDYYFCSKKEFEDKIKNDDLFEYTIYNGNYYGTPKSDIINKLNDGIDVFLILDVAGAFNIKKMFPNCKIIFIMPPSIKELKNRLIKRNIDSKESMEKRLLIAQSEIKESNKYDYVIVNENVNDVITCINKFIENEKSKYF